MDSLNMSNSFMEDQDACCLDMVDDLFAGDGDLGGSDFGTIFDEDQRTDNSDNDNANDNNNGNNNDSLCGSSSPGLKKSETDFSKSDDGITATGSSKDDIIAIAIKEKGAKPNSKRRRSSTPLELDEPLPAWHNEVTDEPLRSKMINEISALLKARKKGEPTKEWLDQLPHKTRVLEDKLYKKARSLEEYVDRTTLKNRLRRLAVTIAAHYNESVKKSKRRSVGSLSSIATVPHRNSLLSFGDTDDNTANMTAQLLAARSGSTQNNIIFSAEGRMGTVARPTANGNNDQQHNKVPSEMAISDLARQKTAQNGIVSNIQQQQVLVNGVRKGSNSLSGGITDNGNSAGANKSATGKDSGSSTVVTQQVGDTGETRLQNSSGNGTNSGDNKGDNTDARRSQFYGIATTNNVLQGNQIDIGTHAMPMMSDSSQAGLIGQQSMPVASSFNNGNSSIGDMNSHAALTGQQSMPISTGGGGGAVQLGGNHNQAQIQLQQLMAQQAALSMQQNSGVGNLAQQQVMQAEFFRQASQSSAQMNMAQQAQLQAEMMRRASAASGGVNPMNQQQLLAQAQMQAEMMRRASIGSLGTMSSHAVPIGGQYGMMPQAGGMVNPVMMNQQMGQMFGNNPQMMQGNANTMQPMNMNMGQVNNVQQQQQQQQQQQNFMSNIAAVPSQNSFSMHGMVNMQNDNNNNGSNANNLQEGNGKDNTSSSENPFDW